MFGYRSVGVVFALSVISIAVGDNKTYKGDRGESLKSLFRDCVHTYSLTCLKLDVVSWVDKLGEVERFNVFPGVALIREKRIDLASSDDMLNEVARAFPNDAESRLTAFLMRKLQNYLHNHALKLNFASSQLPEEARGKGGGGGFGGGKKGGGGMGAVLAMGAMMKGMMMSMAIAGVAAIAGKALMTAMMSLMLSAILGAKALSHGGEKHSTVEVHAKPHHERSDIGYVYHRRSLDTPMPLTLQTNFEPTEFSK